MKCLQLGGLTQFAWNFLGFHTEGSASQEPP